MGHSRYRLCDGPPFMTRRVSTAFPRSAWERETDFKQVMANRKNPFAMSAKKTTYMLIPRQRYKQRSQSWDVAVTVSATNKCRIF